jgi:short-subunit dehydrogenase
MSAKQHFIVMNRKIALNRGLLLALGAGIAMALLRKRSRFSFKDRTVVITGGSRGLGLLIARRLAAEGAQLVLMARNADELRAAQAELTEQGANVLITRCDIRKREQVDHAVQRAVDHFGKIDVLINNAGVIQVGPLAHMTIEDFEDAMAVHFFGPLFMTFAVLPHMRAEGVGRIVNIASIGGKIAVPHLAPYSASKSALAGLSDGLRAELRQHGIRVTTVLPGPMRTGSPPNAQFKGRYQQEYAWFALMDALPLLSISAERAATKIVEACRRGAPRLSIGVQTKAAVALNELLPGMSAQVTSLMNRLLPAADPNGSKEPHVGWESHSAVAPSWLTYLSDQATHHNNERPAYG